MTQVAAIGDVADVFNGKTPSKSEQRDAGYPVLKIRDVDALGNMRGKFESFVDAGFAEKFRAKHLHQGDTLILNAAHNADYVASKTFFASQAHGNPLITGEWTVVRPNKSLADPSYVRHYIASAATKQRIKEMVSGIHLYPKDVAKCPIPLPSLPEQRRIATILDKADSLRAKRREAIVKLHKLLQAVFFDIFGDPATNPMGWRMAEINEVLLEHRPGANIAPEDFTGEGFPVLHKGAIRPFGELEVDGGKKTCVSGNFAALKPRSVVGSEFVAVTLRDLVPSGPTIGLAASIYRSSESEYLLVQGAYGLRLDRSEILDDYFVWLSNTPYFKGQVKRISVGSTQIHCRFPLYAGIRIAVPPVRLQEKFKEVVTSALQIKKRHAFGLRMNDGLWQSLQERAFLGGI